MLAFCSIVNYIDQLTASVAITDFSPWGMVGVSWPFFDGVSWHIYFQWTKVFRNQFSVFKHFRTIFLTFYLPKQNICCKITKSSHNIWTASSEFGTYRLCEQRRFRRACAFAQSRQTLRCSLIQAVSQKEPSDRKPDPWPLWMAGHAQLKFAMTECSKTQIRLTGLIYVCKSYYMYISPSMEFCMWANLARHVGQLTPMRGKVAHVYLPYKSRNFVKIMGVLYAFLGRNMSRKAGSLVQT